MNSEIKQKFDEKELNPISGWVGVLIQLFVIIVGIILAVLAAIYSENDALVITLSVFSSVILLGSFVLIGGYKQIAPNEALVLLFFGKYYGTIKKEGFFFVNPLCIGFNPAIEKKPIEESAESTVSGYSLTGNSGSPRESEKES